MDFKLPAKQKTSEQSRYIANSNNDDAEKDNDTVKVFLNAH